MAELWGESSSAAKQQSQCHITTSETQCSLLSFRPQAQRVAALTRRCHRPSTAMADSVTEELESPRKVS